MSYDFEAIFDDGVFRPLVPIAIPNGQQVRLRVEERPAEDGAEIVAQRKAAIAEFLKLAEELPSADSKLMTQEEKSEFLRMMIELPVEGPDDGFSGSDHDKLLYGQP